MSDTDKPPRVFRTRHPMLLGFLGGLIFGVGVSLGVAMFVNRVASPFMHKQSAANGVHPTQQNAESAMPASDKQAGDKKPSSAAAPAGQEQLAAIAGPPPMVAPTGPSPKPAANTTATTPGDPASAPAGSSGGRHFLQVGSFAAAADADNRKAKLALLGFEAMVRAVQVPDKGTVHRVIVGPFATPAEMEEAKAELAANNFASSLISKQAMANGQ